MVGALTWGITFAMFFLGGMADKWGVRIALLVAFFFMLCGRFLLAGSASLGLEAGGMWSSIHLIAMAGILLIVIGYGMYQPAAYAAVRQFTTARNSAMGYAMLYALMNLGGYLPTYMTYVRNEVGISGSYWVFSAFTAVALFLTFVILTKPVVEKAIKKAKEDQAREKKEAGATEEPAKTEPEPVKEETVSPHEVPGAFQKMICWFRNHPLADAKFAFFIFCLIPVQTLFAHNWLTLPMYVERGFRETWPWISENFEFAINFNPLLIFILVPIVTRLTLKASVYKMMILGTLVMAAPTFLLAIGPYPWTLTAYILIMTLGEAMWQPRFLQYAAEIAPEGRTGAYMGVAQFPWFLTKMVTSLYSGWFLANYCPDPDAAPGAEGMMAAMNTETMWLIYGGIAMSSTIMLVLAKGWVGKDFKTKAD